MSIVLLICCWWHAWDVKYLPPTSSSRLRLCLKVNFARAVPESDLNIPLFEPLPLPPPRPRYSPLAAYKADFLDQIHPVPFPIIVNANNTGQHRTAQVSPGQVRKAHADSSDLSFFRTVAVVTNLMLPA